jgi:hypothetical protein
MASADWLQAPGIVEVYSTRASWGQRTVARLATLFTVVLCLGRGVNEPRYERRDSMIETLVGEPGDVKAQDG